MHHGNSVAVIELIITSSYFMILLGFVLRTILEGQQVRLLWPWLLVSIFGLCALTRLNYVGILGFPLNGLLHALLAAFSLAYGVSQLIYAIWPELFEDDEYSWFPRFTKDF